MSARAALASLTLGLAVRGVALLGVTLLGVALLGVTLLGLSGTPVSGSPVDAVTCLTTAEQIDDGETVSQRERDEAHQACLRALSATASVLQKYQFQEADFLITGKRAP